MISTFYESDIIFYYERLLRSLSFWEEKGNSNEFHSK